MSNEIKLYPRYNPETEQALRDFTAEVKQLCKDFSDLRDRPYMSDVTNTLDSLLEQCLKTQEPPAEQPDQPVAWTTQREREILKSGNVASVYPNNVLTKIPVFLHADPGEVEKANKLAETAADQVVKLLAQLRDANDKLAERDALLEEAYWDGWNDGQEAIEQRYQTTPRTRTAGWERFKADNALSASAEPSAPKSKPRAHDAMMFQRAPTPPKCCEPTAEEQALLAAGDYRPEELWGGSRPACPKRINKPPQE